MTFFLKLHSLKIKQTKMKQNKTKTKHAQANTHEGAPTNLKATCIFSHSYVNINRVTESVKF